MNAGSLSVMNTAIRANKHTWSNTSRPTSGSALPRSSGEGPSWDARSNQFSWVDILAPDAAGVRLSWEAPVTELRLPSHVGAALPAASGGWLVALTDRLAHLQPDGRLRDVVALEAHLPGNRANDAKCDPSGRAWVGTMSYDESRVEGSLYRVDPGRK